jgi:hypothetical protein
MIFHKFTLLEVKHSVIMGWDALRGESICQAVVFSPVIVSQRRMSWEKDELWAGLYTEGS